MKKVIGFLAIGLLTLTVSCKDNKEHEHHDGTMHNEETHMESTEDHHHHSKMEETAAVYYCPMKCEGDKTYDKAGECPKCGMDLVVVEKE